MFSRRLAVALSLPAVAVVALAAWVSMNGLPRDEHTCVVGRWSTGCVHAVRALGEERLTDVRCVFRGGDEETLSTFDGLHLRADVLHPRGSTAPFPGLVLLHGSSVYGRKLPLNQALASRFRSQGYMVVAPDLRGFGDSEDPPDAEAPGAFDFSRDVEAALNYLVNSGAAPELLFVVGHSFGAGAALAAVRRDPRIARAVLIGPPRRLNERYFAPDAEELSYFVERWQRDMERPDPIPEPVVRSASLPMDVETSLGEGQGDRLLVIDSEHEDPADLAFMRRVHSEVMPEGTGYWTLPGTDHYLHSGFVLNRACYNTEVLGGAVDRIDEWLRR